MPRYSIVVPTCDRGDLLQHTLQSLLSIERDDVEVIVSDNYSSDSTSAVIQSFVHDRRLTALRTDCRLPMPAHWDFALSHARGTFVIVNGDDDGISPSLLSRIDRIVEELNPKVLSWSLGLYHHPDYNGENTPNTFHFRAGHSGLALALDPIGVAVAYARFQFELFPEGTHFCIRRDIAEKIVQKTGRFFWPSAPDFSAPLLFLLECGPGINNYIYIDDLMGFGGRSRISNGGSWVKEGENERAHRFVAEFEGTDMFPFNALKVPFYFNLHATGIFIARKFYSDKMRGIDVDFRFLFRTIYEEIFKLRYSPVIGTQAEAALDHYLMSCTPDIQAIAKDVKREVATVAEKARNRPRWNARRLIPFRSALKKTIISAGFSDRGVVPVQHMVSLPGSTGGFTNGHELFLGFDAIVRQHNHLTLKSVERAVADDLLRAAYRI